MCARYLGFVLLIWFAGVTHAQNAKACKAPVLNGGYFVPEEDIYGHDAELTYACDSGLKPVAEGWWATSKCENGKWVDKPQCIDENACLPPTIPHGKYNKAQKGWYKEQSSILVQCDNGYVLEDNRRSTCRNGTWTSLPVCERRKDSCSEPPKISHAVIIHRYQEVFSADSEVKYECEEGYTQKGNNIIVCEHGQWSAGPTCNESSADQGHPASDEDVQPEGGDRRESGAGSGKQPEGGGMGTGHHDPAVSGGQPTGGGSETTGHQGGSSSTSDSNNRDSRPILMNVRSCGARPYIENAVIVEEGPMYLKYQCTSYYRLVGLDTVSCYSDGSWSELPTCEEAFCVMDPARSAGYGLVVTQSEYIREGEAKGFHCTTRGLHAFVWCTNRKIVLTRCCSDYGHRYYDDCRVRYQPN
ncbi:complement factor H isoform X3 [Oreochromis niloticus]|uniref:complement factor H isoform X3 n=1 Tax=Oreochromis niloticus TaxID=8128 RepID=UPI000DF28B98|nr:complement factor H isoform X3 [Oreochromis niloticus]